MGRTYGGGGGTMTSKGPGLAGIMKYVVFALIIAFVALLMMYVSGSSRPYEKVRQSVENALDKDSLTEQNMAAFKRNFNLNAADYAGVMYYSTGANISAEEVLLIKVKNDRQIHEVTAAVEQRIESRINDFEGYAPDEVRLLEDSRQSVRGNYIFYACSPKADEYMSAFNSSL